MPPKFDVAPPPRPVEPMRRGGGGWALDSGGHWHATGSAQHRPLLPRICPLETPRPPPQGLPWEGSATETPPGLFSQQGPHRNWPTPGAVLRPPPPAVPCRSPFPPQGGAGIPTPIRNLVEVEAGGGRPIHVSTKLAHPLKVSCIFPAKKIPKKDPKTNTKTKQNRK